jgi:hypothetical protein
MLNKITSEATEPTDAWKLQVQNWGCKCRRTVNYAHEYRVDPDYLDLQYEWLEELMKKSSLPNLEPDCKGGDQKISDAAKKFKE